MNQSITGPVGVVIVAAGSGHRFGDPAKALQLLAGRPLVAYSIEMFDREPQVAQMVVVFGEHTITDGARLVASLRPRDASVCLGGATRSASVLAGLRRLDPELMLVAVHDAARPLVTRELFRSVLAAARISGAAVPGMPVSDTIVAIDTGSISAAPNRSDLRAVQTPQVARRDWLEAALSGNDAATDEGSLLFSRGHSVTVTPGDINNIKITHKFDIERAEALLRCRDEGRE